MLDAVVKLMNTIRSRRLTHRQFRDFLQSLQSKHSDVLYYTKAFSFGRLDCKNSPQSHIVRVYDAVMAKVVFSILLSGMLVIGRAMESGRRGLGSSSGCSQGAVLSLAVCRRSMVIDGVASGVKRLSGGVTSSRRGVGCQS
ncbi:hypothetical protein TNCV_1412881 [Trichonephila clavipes]|nr:hypothetical protein TNCV_1412881 [Trichonephila clavipes]